jgi:hypothetical protein
MSHRPIRPRRFPRTSLWKTVGSHHRQYLGLGRRQREHAAQVGVELSELPAVSTMPV